MKVRVASLQPHCFAFGGFEIQMISALEATREAGVDVQRLDPWSRDVNFDIMHVWGLDIAQTQTIKWARKSHKQIVMTAWLPYVTIQHRLYYAASSLCGVVRMRRKLLDIVDILVVVNELQASAAQVLLGVHESKIKVIPNIIESQYFSNGAVNPDQPIGFEHYVLCTGNICKRKNQLKLAKAAINGGYSLLIIGDVLQGEEGYATELGGVIEGHKSVRWIRGVAPGSATLVSAYANCMAFALPSLIEQQPISALEAAAAGKPLLLADRAYAQQKYFKNAYLVDPNSELSIQDGLGRIKECPTDYIPEKVFLNECTREKVGLAYRDVYDLIQESILSNKF
jgi:glycosyltransferase involved in cell wall biosynthesis